MNKFLSLLSSFSLATIALTSQRLSAITQSEKQMMIFGMFTAVCEIHHENNLSDSIAKFYTKQYLNNANNIYLSKSEIELVKSSLLEVYISCPFPK